MDRDTPSPQPLLYVYIRPFMLCLPQSPKGAPYIDTGKTYGRRPRSHTQRKAYIQRDAAWFLKRTVNDTAISTTVPCGPQHDTFLLGLGRPEP